MLWYFLLGVSTGMRTMTATAVMCWFAWLQFLPQTGWTFWAGNIISAIVFTAAALGEYYGDVLPTTPSRTSPVGVIARLVFAALVGILAARTSGQPIAGGIIFAVVGALVGTYGGHAARIWASARVGKDLPVGVSESLLALGLAIVAASRLYHDRFAENVMNILPARLF
jgi:uncharacterized membrane protein